MNLEYTAFCQDVLVQLIFKDVNLIFGIVKIQILYEK